MTADTKQLTLVLLGGPGLAHLDDAEEQVELLEAAFPASRGFVIVDYAGTSQSDGVDCPEAEILKDSGTPVIMTAADAVSNAKDFAESCVLEIRASAAGLGLLGSRQTVEDLEALREHLGVGEWDIYAESYGTRVAQLYASSYPTRVSRLILDGTVEVAPTLGSWRARGDAFESLLGSVLEWCGGDSGCRSSFINRPVDAYHVTEAELRDRHLRSRDSPSPYSLGLVASILLQHPSGRARLLGLLADADRGRLAGLVAEIESMGVTQSDVDRDGFSEAAYYAIECADWNWETDSPGERAESMLAAASQHGGLSVKAAVVLRDLPCAFWPAASDAPPMSADWAQPTLLLGSNPDIAAPFRFAESTFERNPAAQLVELDGGQHGVLRAMDSCVQAVVGRKHSDGAHVRTNCSTALVAH